jgi:glycosyltransferase involved in cell wall biosynthesis
MKPLRILVDSLADKVLINSQMTNAREIIRRLNPDEFHVSTFYVSEPDPLLVERRNTRLIPLAYHLQTVRIFREFVLGRHKILFYLKSSPASKWYMRLRQKWRDRRVVIGTVEGQCNFRVEPTIAPEAGRLWEKTILRCDYLFSNSSSVKKSLESEYGLPSEVVPTGVDTRFFLPAWERPANPRLRVLFVGSLRPFKGPHVLLEAAHRFPSADFIIVGDGAMAEELAWRVQADQLANVRLAGVLDREALRLEYQSANIFFFPSQWEGSPKVILEAAACGLPVIVRDNYSPETVVDGQTGYIVSSHEELFVRLEELLGNQELREAFGQGGRQHAVQFDWDLITRRWENIFRHLSHEVSSHGA